MLTKLRYLLLPLNLLFHIILLFRYLLYKLGVKTQSELPGTVISVGNIVAGGTGKSPVVMAIAKHLEKKGYFPAILTRGYKSGISKNQGILLQNGNIIDTFGNPYQPHPDEAMMQSQNLLKTPIIVSPSRAAATKWYLKRHPPPTHWILDDGFQHWQIKRNLDLVLLDAQKPIDNGFLFPAGNLREPLKALKRANAILYTRATKTLPSKEIMKSISNYTNSPQYHLNFSNAWPTHSEKQIILDKNFSGNIIVVCALANSNRFKEAIEGLGLRVQSFFQKSDHESFNDQELLSALGNSDIVITTEKDYWRNPNIFRALPIETYISKLEISQIDDFLEKLFTGSQTS